VWTFQIARRCCWVQRDWYFRGEIVFWAWFLSVSHSALLWALPSATLSLSLLEEFDLIHGLSSPRRNCCYHKPCSIELLAPALSLVVPVVSRSCLLCPGSMSCPSTHTFVCKQKSFSYVNYLPKQIEVSRWQDKIISYVKFILQ